MLDSPSNSYDIGSNWEFARASPDNHVSGIVYKVGARLLSALLPDSAHGVHDVQQNINTHNTIAHTVGVAAREPI